MKAIEGRWLAIDLDEKIQLEDWTPFITKDGMRVNGRLGLEHNSAVFSILSFLISVRLTRGMWKKAWLALRNSNCGSRSVLSIET